MICASCLNVAYAQVDRPSAARQELSLGVAAYRSANYEDALQHFNNAVLWDPELKVARLYVATVYAQMYVPGVETPENVANANNALEQYAQVLRSDPVNMTAVKGTAYLNIQLKKLKEAREGYQRAMEIDANDPENFYAAGVIDWSMTYRDLSAEKAKLEQHSETKEDDTDEDAEPETATPDENSEYAMIFSAVCGRLRTEHLQNIEDGIAMETRAIALRKDYDDAMVYLNLLYRLRADLQCGEKTARAADIKKANDWADEAMAARKRKAEAAKKNQAPANGSPQ